MPAELQALIWTAVAIAWLHTASGPDHYLPFIALSKSRNWSITKTVGWTIVCGMGHVLSSVILGLAGAALGWSLSALQWTENIRGGLAAWALLLFGIVYTIVGLYRAKTNRRHKHFDSTAEGELYVFEHDHDRLVLPTERHKVTPWVIFIIFFLGPCEPMIPLLYVPAANHSSAAMMMVVAVYTVVTLATMVAMVLLGFYGISLFDTPKIERHVHTLAGVSLTVCGAGMILWGW